MAKYRHRVTYKEFTERYKKYWIGKRVIFEGEEFTVIDVDSNGGLLINKPARFTDTTAVAAYMVKEV